MGLYFYFWTAVVAALGAALGANWAWARAREQGPDVRTRGLLREAQKETRGEVLALLEDFVKRANPNPRLGDPETLEARLLEAEGRILVAQQEAKEVIDAIGQFHHDHDLMLERWWQHKDGADADPNAAPVAAAFRRMEVYAAERFLELDRRMVAVEAAHRASLERYGELRDDTEEVLVKLTRKLAKK